MKYVLFYESAEDVAALAPPHFEAHRGWIQRFHDEGSLLMVGPFSDAQSEGTMTIFTTKESAERFAGDDPFVRNGVVSSWHIQEWRDFDLSA